MKNVLPLLGFLSLSMSAFAHELPIYVGTYTRGDSEGIYLLHFNNDTGKLVKRGVAAKTENPSFVAIDAKRQYLYAVNETNTGELSAFKINDDQTLTFLNQKPSGGGAPCHLVIDNTGKNLLVANYSGGNTTVTRIETDGTLGEQTSLVQHEGSSVNPNRQQEPHAHSINLDTANRFAVGADLGTDDLFVFRFDPVAGTLTSHSQTEITPAGAGPRHFAFHPDGKHAYVINELLSTVTALAYDADKGTFKQLQTIPTLPRDFEGNSSTAEVRVSADGRFVYGSNRGHDSIAVFRVRPDGRLTLLQIQKIGGKTPRNFTIDPSGKFLLAAGQSSNNIRVFSIDEKTGMLSKTKHMVKVPSPVCIRFAIER